MEETIKDIIQLISNHRFWIGPISLAGTLIVLLLVLKKMFIGTQDETNETDEGTCLYQRGSIHHNRISYLDWIRIGCEFKLEREDNDGQL